MNQDDMQIESRIDRKKEKTRENIIDTAIQLFKSNGVDETTMEQIAREADIAKGTLYNYFPAKEAIIEAFIKRSFSRKNTERLSGLRAMPDTRSRMKAVFRELLLGVQAQKEIFEKYIVYRMQSMVSFRQEENARSGIALLVNEVIGLGQKSGELREDLPPFILEDLFLFSFIEMVKQYYFDPEGFHSDEAIDKCIDIFINGVRKAPIN